jgi:hypothetical protein
VAARLRLENNQEDKTMTKKATIDNIEMVDRYAISRIDRNVGDKPFQLIVRTSEKIGAFARVEPFGVECMLVPDAATHEKPAIIVTAAEWLKLRGILPLR